MMTSQTVAPNSISSSTDLVDVLTKLSVNQETACLSIQKGQVVWNVYFDEGQVYYSSNTSQTLNLFKFYLGSCGDSGNSVAKSLSSYAVESFSIEQAIADIVQQGDLIADRIPKLIFELTKESLETLFWIEEATYTIQIGKRTTFEGENDLQLSKLELNKLIGYFKKRLQQWQSIQSLIKSPYERLYLFDYNGVLENDVQSGVLSSRIYQIFVRFFKGLSLREIAPIFGQDELKIAKLIIPYIQKGAIVLREPAEPFSYLPSVPASNDSHQKNATDIEESDKTTKIVCIDDSPSILEEMQRLLSSEEGIEVTKIEDPIKASSMLFRIRPDLILMDVTMPEINGYKLCSLLRDSEMFKDTPIVMVTGNRGLIDKARAKIAGATDYLTKPFTQDSLLHMVGKYL